MKTRTIDPRIQNSLLNAADFRVFLKVLLQGPEGKRRGELAEVCRRAGFSSRSYVSELLAGKKGLSRDSLARLKSALRLPKPWAQYFECLVWKSETALRPKSYADGALEERIKSLKQTLMQPTRDAQKVESIVASTLCNPKTFQIYAALGSETSGASLDEIMKRTGFSAEVANQGLSELMQSAAVIVKGKKYFALTEKADALAFKGKAQLAEMVRAVTTNLRDQRDTLVRNPTNLVLYSAFSVRSTDMMALKERLQEAIFDVLDEFQDDSGDKVEQIFVTVSNDA